MPLTVRSGSIVVVASFLSEKPDPKSFSIVLGPTPAMPPRTSFMRSGSPSNSFWLMTSMSHSVSFEASRTFWPRAPMARESWSSATMTRASRARELRLMASTSAGLSALAIRMSDWSLQRTMSIRSPPSSATMFLMRVPRTPTQAPTASTFESTDVTAILVR